MPTAAVLGAAAEREVGWQHGPPTSEVDSALFFRLSCLPPHRLLPPKPKGETAEAGSQGNIPEHIDADMALVPLSGRNSTAFRPVPFLASSKSDLFYHPLLPSRRPSSRPSLLKQTKTEDGMMGGTSARATRSHDGAYAIQTTQARGNMLGVGGGWGRVVLPALRQPYGYPAESARVQSTIDKEEGRGATT